jgi:single-strand DNA-binding protein
LDWASEVLGQTVTTFGELSAGEVHTLIDNLTGEEKQYKENHYESNRGGSMAKGVNKVILVGNVGKDPEMKYTPGGTAIAIFSLATTESYKNRDDQWEEKTEWHNIKAFGKLAETISEYVKKGKQLYLEGKIQTESWDDKNSGEKKYRTSIVVFQMVFLGSKDGNGSSGKSNGSSKQQSSQITDDDIPF